MTQRVTAFFSSTILLFTFAVAPAAQAQEGLVINEFLADPGSYTGGEFVEIYNGTGGAVNLDGYTISDADNDRYIFGEDGPSVTLEDGQSATITDDPADVPGFDDDDFLSLNNDGDTITLTDDQSAVVDTYTYMGSEVISGVSQALIPNGNLTNDFQRQDENGAMENVTPGRDNGDDSALPVEFAGAPAARVDGNAVTLRWTTLTEENNLGFRAQYRRTDPQGAGDWTTAEKRVDGAGNSHAEQHYDYTVTNLVPGRYEFRIEQVDTDDDRSHSETVEATVRAESFALQTPKQNPFHARTELTYSAPGSDEVEAVLYNSLGQQVRTLRATGGRITLEAGSLASGVYFVHITAGRRADTQSVTLVR